MHDSHFYFFILVNQPGTVIRCITSIHFYICINVVVIKSESYTNFSVLRLIKKFYGLDYSCLKVVSKKKKKRNYNLGCILNFFTNIPVIKYPKPFFFFLFKNIRDTNKLDKTTSVTLTDKPLEFDCNYEN